MAAVASKRSLDALDALPPVKRAHSNHDESMSPAPGLSLLMLGIESQLNRELPPAPARSFSVMSLLSDPPPTLPPLSLPPIPPCPPQVLAWQAGAAPPRYEPAEMMALPRAPPVVQPAAHATADEMRNPWRVPEVVVTVLHACVAQKSYGSEKRFLCPPPIVEVTGLPSSDKPALQMSIVNEDGSRGVEHKTIADDAGSATFKYLHVASSKSKRFCLRLRLFQEQQLVNTFESKPITIISKPSKKTSKTRNHSLSIVSGSVIALFNRVNSQTVRTKYMAMEDGRLCAKSASWSAFTIRAVDDPHGRGGSPPVISYGMEVVLVDVETGAVSDVFVVRKVAKDTVIGDATGPVSQLQKIALQRRGHRDLFLSTAVSESAGSPPAAPSSLLASALCFQHITAIASEDSSGASSPSSPPAAAPAPAPYGVESAESGVAWTIVGVDKTQFRYQVLPDARSASSFACPSAPPVVVSARAVDAAGSLIELHGTRLDRGFMVLLGKTPVKSFVTGGGALSFSVPTLSDAEFAAEADAVQPGLRRVVQPILLARDGTVFHTQYCLQIDCAEHESVASARRSIVAP